MGRRGRKKGSKSSEARLSVGRENTCQRHPDEWTTIEVDGKDTKACVDCLSLKHIIKKCLKCEREFTPSCLLRFLCVNCADSNKRYSDTYTVNI